MTQFTDPFAYEGNDVINLVSRAVMPDKKRNGILRVEEIGEAKAKEFISERLASKQKSIWDPMKKTSLSLWKSSLKKTKVTVEDKVIELREDRGLFARMLIVANSRPNIHLEQVLSVYEFSVVPRALFARDGTMHHCSSKSQLMKVLKDSAVPVPSTGSPDESSLFSVAIVDAMSVVQSLSKPKSIETCSDLAEHFVSVVMSKFSDYNEVHLIFDRYDIPQSLKTATRTLRQGGREIISYHIADNTSLKQVSMSTLLASCSTKNELTIYLSKHVIEAATKHNLCYMVSFCDKVLSTQIQCAHMRSTQEEADTKIVLHSTDAYARGANKIDIFCSDTDVLVLLLRRYDEMLPHLTQFIYGNAENRTVINLREIISGIGLNCAGALPAFHALTGADNTGAMNGKGKMSCWKGLEAAGSSAIVALTNMSNIKSPSDVLTDTDMKSLERLICNIYQPGTAILTLGELRWWMFRRNQAESEKLPPTLAAFRQSVKRAVYQCMVWSNDITPIPIFPKPEEYGWKKEQTHAGDIYI